MQMVLRCATVPQRTGFVERVQMHLNLFAELRGGVMLLAKPRLRNAQNSEQL